MVGGTCSLNPAGLLDVPLQMEAEAAQGGRTTFGMAA